MITSNNPHLLFFSLKTFKKMRTNKKFTPIYHKTTLTTKYLYALAKLATEEEIEIEFMRQSAIEPSENAVFTYLKYQVIFSLGRPPVGSNPCQQLNRYNTLSLSFHPTQRPLREFGGETGYPGSKANFQCLESSFNTRCGGRFTDW